MVDQLIHLSIHPSLLIKINHIQENQPNYYILQDAVPFAVVGSNAVMDVRGKKVRGRVYPWGVVEVENPEHCDFIKMRTMLM